MRSMSLTSGLALLLLTAGRDWLRKWTDTFSAEKGECMLHSAHVAILKKKEEREAA